MTDIVERLREYRDKMGVGQLLREEAADEIDRLREEGTVELAKALLEIERLRAEVELWKDRWKTEYEDHQVTINHANKTMRGKP